MIHRAAVTGQVGVQALVIARGLDAAPIAAPPIYDHVEGARVRIGAGRRIGIAGIFAAAEFIIERAEIGILRCRGS